MLFRQCKASNDEHEGVANHSINGGLSPESPCRKEKIIAALTEVEI
jgi:hypothetical protein